MTLDQLTADVRNMGFDKFSDSVVQRAIINIDRRVRGMRRWKFLLKTNEALTTTSGTNSVSLAAITDLRDIESVRLVNNVQTSYVWDLQPLTFQAFKTVSFGFNNSGQPEYWTERNGTLLFWPTPNRAYTISVDYIGTGTTLSAGSDVSSIPDTYAGLLAWGAAMELFIRERNSTEYQNAKIEFNERLSEMVRQQNLDQRQDSNTVGQTGIYEDWV